MWAMRGKIGFSAMIYWVDDTIDKGKNKEGATGFRSMNSGLGSDFEKLCYI